MQRATESDRGYQHDRIAILDPLRGLAALAVAWFHFTHGNPTFLPAGILKASGTYGWSGVDAFFVISGFVLPYSMYRAGYSPRRDWKIFALKRIIRLDPPYLVSIAALLVLQFLSMHVPGYKGEAWSASLPQVLLHLGYLNTFVGYPWLSPVYWTLAIEAQFYLLIAILQPSVVSERAMTRWLLVTTAIAAGFLLPFTGWIFPYLTLFAIGAATFQFRIGRLKMHTYLAMLVVLVAATWWIQQPAAALAGACAALIIAFYRGAVPRPLVLLGYISYSLYLMHVPIGGRVINLATRLPSTLPWHLLALAVAITSSIAAAYLLYATVELPARRWSAALKYRGREEPTALECIPTTSKQEVATL
jgi:peptidoglycan/LPS O-acetylase OafA/YrhL